MWPALGRPDAEVAVLGFPPAGGGDSCGANRRPGLPCSSRAPPCAPAPRRRAAGPERGRRSRAPRTPRRPRDRVPVFACARRGRAGQAGAGARAAGPSGVIAGSGRKSCPPKPPGARGRRGLQPGARVVSEPWRQLEFCVSGELAELVALCWEFRGYCGHPGEGSSLHLDRDATETSHRFLPSCEWSLPVRSGDGVCELDGISALSSSAFKQVPRL